jgi:hypothetical protein
MAIKGKGRSRQRAAPRAPRHVPVAPPTPVFRRTWVQLMFGFLLGALAVIALVWVTNSMRAGDEVDRSRTEATARRTAALDYQRAVRGAFGQVGVVEPGVPPTVFADMDASFEAMASARAPSDAGATFAEAARDAAGALEALEAFDVRAAVADRGFDPIVVASYTGSADSLRQALALFREAARVGASAASLGGPEGKDLAGVAIGLRDTARQELGDGWTEYLQALRASGLPEAPSGDLVPELPGGGG